MQDTNIEFKPWKVVEWSRHNRDHKQYTYTISGSCFEHIISVGKNKKTACLIASAPEMLFTLEQILVWMKANNIGGDLKNITEETIKRAKNESIL